MSGSRRDPSRVLPLSARVSVPHGSTALLLGLGLSACAGPRSGALVAPAEAGGATTEVDRAPVVARVAGQPLTTAQLLQSWLHSDSRGVRALLDELILERLIVLEAVRLGVSVDTGKRQAARHRALDRLDQEVAASGAGGLSSDEFLRQRLGLNPGPYKERIQYQAELDLLAERVVRAWLLCTPHAQVRVIVLENQGQVSEVQALLAAGESFDHLARTWSVDDSGAEGGRVPPVVRGRAPLALVAFETPVGEVGGPVREGDRWLLMQVDARPTPLSPEHSDELSQAVEASLLLRPIEDPEYWQWKSAVVLEHEVDMTPFLRLMGDVALD